MRLFVWIGLCKTGTSLVDFRRGRPQCLSSATRQPAGRGIARLCRTSTEPSEIKAHPIHSGGWSVLRGPELPEGVMG